MSEQNHFTYEQSGVDYAVLDQFKVAAQSAAAQTAPNLRWSGYEEVASSRGESAYVWDRGENYGAVVTEGLGTKNLVADAMREISGRTHYDAIAQDTVAAIVNDLVAVGAQPEVITAHFSVGDSNWFNDEQRTADLIGGWTRACNLARAVWGSGETPVLKGVLQPDAIELSGSAIGSIYPKERLMTGDKLQPGDFMVYLPSSGIHANGLTLAREIAANLPDGFATKLSDGSAYGESLLEPTILYADAMVQLFGTGVDVHYAVNITGHGWRKLMRANRELSYHVSFLPEPQPAFNFIQEHSGASDEEMYGTFNMGAGLMVYVARDQLQLTLGALQRNGYAARLAGHVEAGPRQVVIVPKNIIFESDSLNLR